MRRNKIIAFSLVGALMASLGGFAAYCVWVRPPAFLPPSVSSLFTRLPQVAPSDLLSLANVSAPKEPVQEKQSGDTATAPAAEKPPATTECVWTNMPVTEPLLREPGVRRSQVVVNKRSRLLRGEIKAVSPTHGLLVSLPKHIGSDGVIASETLIADFPRRFQVGEKITVAVAGVSMKGSLKQLDLLLVEP